VPQAAVKYRRERKIAPSPSRTDRQQLSWEDAVEDFLDDKKGENVTSSTLANYRWILLGPRSQQLRHDQGIERPADLTDDALKGFQRELLEAGARPATVHAFHRGFKTFLGFCLAKGYGVDGAVLQVKGPRLSQVEPEVFTADEEKRLRAAARDPRDRLLIDFMLRTGLRLSEVCNVRLEDLQTGPYGALLKVRQGKGRKDRTVALDTSSDKLSETIDRYIRRDRPKSTDAHLFLTRRRKGGRDGEFTALTPRAVQVLLRRLGEEAGGVNANPHKFRHTFATESLAAGIDVMALKQALGHTTLAMVSRYVHYQDKEMLAAWARRP
jgi:site-specific recombinase XerD